MTAVFTAAPQFTVLAGRQEIGRTDPMLLTGKVDGPRLLLLAGQSWKVTWVDWKRRRCQVEPADSGGRAGWHGARIPWTSMFGGGELARCRHRVQLQNVPLG